MTKLVLDPLNLSLEFPKASNSNLHRIRILAQVIAYDDDTSTLRITKVQNIPQLHTVINLIDEPLSERDTLDLNVFNVLSTLNIEVTYPGTIVNIIGYYNGDDVNVVECYPVNGGTIIPEKNVQVLAGLSSLKDFD